MSGVFALITTGSIGGRSPVVGSSSSALKKHKSIRKENRAEKRREAEKKQKASKEEETEKGREEKPREGLEAREDSFSLTYFWFRYITFDCKPVEVSRYSFRGTTSAIPSSETLNV